MWSDLIYLVDESEVDAEAPRKAEPLLTRSEDTELTTRLGVCN